MRTDVSDEKEPSFKNPKGRFWTVGWSKAKPAELTWHVQETGFTEVHGISKGVLGVGGYHQTRCEKPGKARLCRTLQTMGLFYLL